MSPILAAALGVLLSAPANAAPATTIDASCQGVSIDAQGYSTPAPGTPGNVYLIAVYSHHVASWTAGYFGDHTNVSVSVPQNGHHHRVQVFVHDATDPAGVSATVDKFTARCS